MSRPIDSMFYLRITQIYLCLGSILSILALIRISRLLVSISEERRKVSLSIYTEMIIPKFQVREALSTNLTQLKVVVIINPLKTLKLNK